MDVDRNAPRELIADQRWLRELAARLIGDPALADDACQEAWLQAARAGRVEARERRPALFRAMRRFAWRWRRSEGRRSRREAQCSPSAELPSTEELLSRGEQRQLLWRRLTELDEPYRTALLLRFQEGLDTATIATRSQAREDTVRWRIRRGLELLRERYEREERGGMSALALAALPLGTPSTTVAAGATAIASSSVPVAAATTLFGAWMMKKSVAVAAVVIVACLVGSIAWQMDSESAPDELPPPAAEPARAIADVIPVGGLMPDEAPERVAAAPASVTPVEKSVEAVGCRVFGVVVDPHGDPIANALVQLVAGPDHWNATPVWTRETRSGFDGAFELRTADRQQPDPVRLKVTVSPLHALVEKSFGRESGAHFGPLETDEISVGQVVVGAASLVTGRIVDRNGAPIEGGWIDDANDVGFTRSDADGRFRLAHLRSGERRITIKAAGYLVREAGAKLVAGRAFDLGELSLEDAPRVRGVVTDTTGRPLAGAMVSTRGFTRGWVFDAAADGTFDAPLPTDGPGKIYARADGYVQSKAKRVVPGDREVVIELERRKPRAVFAVVDRETGEPVTRIALRILKGAGGKNGVDVAAPDWDRPRVRTFRTGRLGVTARVGVDGYEVLAPGFRRARGEVLAQAFEDGGQRIELERAPGLTGRIVDGDGRGVPGLAIRLVLGGLGRVENLETGEAVPVEEGSETARILRAQGGYTVHTLFPIDRPLPALVLGSFFGPDEHRAFTDENGRFRFDVRSGVGRLIVTGSSDRKLSNDHFVIANEDDGLELGDLPLLATTTVHGQVLPSLPIDFTGSEVVCKTAAKLRVDVAADGKFTLPDLAPGSHRFVVKVGDHVCGPDLSSREFFIRVEAGKERRIEVPLPVLPACQLQATLRINGAVAPGADITFLRVDGDKRVGEIETGADGSGSGTVQAGVAIRARVYLDGAAMLVGKPFVLPAGPFHRDLELDTAALTINLPSAFELPEPGIFALRWQRADGTSGTEQRLYVSDRKRVLGSTQAGDLRTLFPRVPTAARTLELFVKKGAPYSSNPWKRVGSFSRELQAAAAITVDLP